MKQVTVSTFMMSKANLELIRKAGQCLGYSKLKKEQEMALLSFISGNDVFVSLPTGGNTGPGSSTSGLSVILRLLTTLLSSSNVHSSVIFDVSRSLSMNGR